MRGVIQRKSKRLIARSKSKHIKNIIGTLLYTKWSNHYKYFDPPEYAEISNPSEN